MSTDRKRLSSAIQRIAREDPEIRDIIQDFRNRGGVGSASATVAGADDGRQLCCDGSSSDNDNPGSDIRDPSEGGQDGLNPDDPANLDSMGPGSLGGVTDCTTGEPICFDGADWIRPTGWELGEIYDPEGSYEEGYYWVSGYSPSSSNCDTVAPTRDASVAAFNAIYEGMGYSAFPRQHECGSGACAGDQDAQCSDLINDKEWRMMPSDDCINLAIKGGKFVASKYDPDVTSGNGWLKGKEEVELCDGQGNSFTVRASGSLPGGWKTISAQNPGDGYLYDATGTQVARISGSEYSDPSV